MKRFFLALLVLILASCKDQGTGPHPSAYELWSSRGLHAYTIDQIRACYCINGGAKMQVTVRADTVTRVLRLYDSTELSLSESRFYLTVDSLCALTRHPPGDSLVVAYNADFGYPEGLDIDPQLHPVDGGVLYETSNLRIP